MGTVFYEGTHRGEFIEAELPDNLSRDSVLILSGQSLKAGHVLGKILVGATAVAVAAAGNTGNGVMGAITVGAAAANGIYQLVIVGAAANAGVFEVEGPDGKIIGTGNVAAAFNASGLQFTLADGATDFKEGDRFTITVSAGTAKYKEWNPASTDGSQNACAISYDAVDATGGDTPGVIVDHECRALTGSLVWFSGATTNQIAMGLSQLATHRIKGV
ncbi:head decoration protein [Nitrospirillum bahiense]|uniref:Bacteriophage lambda head decoration protein D n=1 Tax=Nitrospirillum amazonense TaxID=28077 RepID=A0A560F1V0_9PROT|nr:head decoration protein [Nitrospirillum amazonense]TWB15602.1 bacteriophage lambda head decoration protein D [Nitrospirillum amazonense]